MKPAELAFFNVMTDVVHLCKFRETQQVQRGVWENIPEAVRRRFIAQEYVKIQPHRVCATELALEVMQYREATA